jgi:hypothetical protein
VLTASPTRALLLTITVNKEELVNTHLVKTGAVPTRALLLTITVNKEELVNTHLVTTGAVNQTAAMRSRDT